MKMQFGIINNTTIILKLIFFFHYFLQQFSIQATITNNKLVQVGKLKLSTIGVGTWSWGNRFLWQYDTNQDPELYKTYQYCIDNGINWFDTADSYGTGKLSGRSEELLGQFKQQRLEQQQEKQSQSSSFFSSFTNKNIVKSPSTSSRANIITKLAPYPWRIGTQSMITAAEQSSLRLQQPIDILQLHWPPALQWQEKEYLQAFSQIVDAGGATQIGLSNYGPKSLRRVCCILDQYQQKPYSNQVQFSLLSRYPLTSGLQEECNDKGIQLIGYSPLALGLLTDKYDIDKNIVPTGLRGILCREYLPAMKPLLGTLREIAKLKRKSVSQVVINWNIQKGFLVLVGARSVAQVKENLGGLGWNLKPEEVLEIDISASKVKKQLVQNSFQSD